MQAYGRELNEAYEWCQKYKHSRKEAELHQHWEIYKYTVSHSTPLTENPNDVCRPMEGS